MNEEGLKLTSYSSEHDRVGGRYVADELLDVFARHRLRVAAWPGWTERFALRRRVLPALAGGRRGASIGASTT